MCYVLCGCVLHSTLEDRDFQVPLLTPNEFSDYLVNAAKMFRMHSDEALKFYKKEMEVLKRHEALVSGPQWVDQ